MIKRFWPLLLVIALGCSSGQETSDTGDQTPSVEQDTETSTAPVELTFTDYRTGDIVFQASKVPLHQALKGEDIPYAHVGLINVNHVGLVNVVEAYGVVKVTPLDEWMKRNSNDHFVVKRLTFSDTLNNPELVNKLKYFAKNQINKEEDGYLKWDNERMANTELVWKSFMMGTNILLCKTRYLESLDLSNEEVMQVMNEHWKGDINMEEQVVTVADMYNSSKLFTVHEQ